MGITILFGNSLSLNFKKFIQKCCSQLFLPGGTISNFEKGYYH